MSSTSETSEDSNSVNAAIFSSLDKYSSSLYSLNPSIALISDSYSDSLGFTSHLSISNPYYKFLSAIPHPDSCACRSSSKLSQLQWLKKKQSLPPVVSNKKYIVFAFFCSRCCCCCCCWRWETSKQKAT